LNELAAVVGVREGLEAGVVDHPRDALGTRARVDDHRYGAELPRSQAECNDVRPRAQREPADAVPLADPSLPLVGGADAPGVVVEVGEGPALAARAVDDRLLRAELRLQPQQDVLERLRGQDRPSSTGGTSRFPPWAPLPAGGP